jgi:CheY-like chemotaxis protein
MIVDASRESREVLRTLLERRGARTIEADGPEEALRLADACRPDLIVFDAESDLSTTSKPTNELRVAAGRTDTPIVILGKVRQLQPPLPPGQVVAKPYHYGSLIRKIDGLLDAA